MRRIMQGPVNNPRAATQTEQEAETSTQTYVSPGTQANHPTAIKAFGEFLSTAAATPFLVTASSRGLATLTSGATGRVRIFFTTPFSTTNYLGWGTAFRATGAASGAVIPHVFVQTVSTCDVLIYNDGGTLVSTWTSLHMFFIGDQ